MAQPFWLHTQNILYISSWGRARDEICEQCWQVVPILLLTAKAFHYAHLPLEISHTCRRAAKEKQRADATAAEAAQATAQELAAAQKAAAVAEDRFATAAAEAERAVADLRDYKVESTLQHLMTSAMTHKEACMTQQLVELHLVPSHTL